jgi:hypothetical protein
LKKVEELGDRSQGSGVSTNSSVLTPNQSLFEALQDLFEKSLAEAAAEELENEVKDKGEGEEEPLTQEEAEKIYEEIMGNE